MVDFGNIWDSLFKTTSDSETKRHFQEWATVDSFKVREFNPVVFSAKATDVVIQGSPEKESSAWEVNV